MAGKHVGGSVALSGFTAVNRIRAPHHFQPKIDKAYAEGRANGGGTERNPHPAGSPAAVAHTAGWTRSDNDTWIYETGIPSF